MNKHEQVWDKMLDTLIDLRVDEVITKEEFKKRESEIWRLNYDDASQELTRSLFSLNFEESEKLRDTLSWLASDEGKEDIVRGVVRYFKTH